MKMISKELKEIVVFLKSENIKLSAKNRDGRINSSFNETQILNVISQKFRIEIPRSRSWFDFAVQEKNFYPVNIKITDTTHADNLNCKLGLYYALTGMMPSFPNEIGWRECFRFLKKDLKKNDKDYYFLVINKQNSKDIFLNSLKSLAVLQPNGNNLPFQCKWDINKMPAQRNFDEAVKFLLTCFSVSIKQRAEIYFDFKKHFNEYIVSC